MPWPGERDPQGASQAWKPAAKAALRQRFSGGGHPLWGITWLKGDGAGELLLTFHHSIADGLSSMALVQRLFVLLAAQGSATDPSPSKNWEALNPDLGRAFPWQTQDATEVTTLSDRQDRGLTTSYALSELSCPSTQGVQAWTRRRGLWSPLPSIFTGFSKGSFGRELPNRPCSPLVRPSAMTPPPEPSGSGAGGKGV